MTAIQEKCTSILKDYWGYTEFRPGQFEIIEDIKLIEDTVCVWSTNNFPAKVLSSEYATQ